MHQKSYTKHARHRRLDYIAELNANLNRSLVAIELVRVRLALRLAKAQKLTIEALINGIGSFKNYSFQGSIRLLIRDSIGFNMDAFIIRTNFGASL